MTAIAAKLADGEWQFACDGRITDGDVKAELVSPKWMEVRGHFLAFAGTCADLAKLSTWVRECDAYDLASAINVYLADEDLDVSVLLHREGDAAVYHCSLGYAHAEYRMAAAGSGDDVAWGAMAAGASPIEAVQIAGKRLCSVGPPYFELSRPVGRCSERTPSRRKKVR